MARKLPPIPKTLPSLLGPISITRENALKDEKQRECFGICNHGRRTVRLDTDMAPETAWQTYWHEWSHMVISDAGVQIPHALRERICDAFANARVREMLDA